MVISQGLSVELGVVSTFKQIIQNTLTQCIPTFLSQEKLVQHEEQAVVSHDFPIIH